MTITNPMIENVMKKMQKITNVKEANFSNESINGTHVLFAAKNSKEALAIGERLYTMINQLYGLKHHQSTLCWSITPFTDDGDDFSNQYQLKIGVRK